MSKGQTLLRAGVQFPSLSPGPGLKQEIPETPQMKEEPEEQSVKQEEEQLPVSVSEVITVCVKAEESSGEDFSSEAEGHAETSDETDKDDDWEQEETKTDADHYNQVQTRGRRSKHSTKYKSPPESSTTVNTEDMSGDEGAEPKHRKKKHQCSVCKKRFGTKQILQRHNRVHTGEKPYSCSVCEKAFALKGNLHIHVMRTHSGEAGADGAQGKKHQCSLCKKKFWTKRDLVKHTRVHTREKPYSCSVCKKGFAQKGHLDAHMRTHSGEGAGDMSGTDHGAERQKQQCPFCHKTFSSRQGLHSHIRVHTGDTPYRCLLCEKAYCYESKLKLHMRTHTGEKPYSCSTCKATLATSNALKVHMRTHTGEKPYSCSICTKMFTYKINRDRHMETHTEKHYRCSFCTTTFCRKDDLNAHVKSHRGNITINGLVCKMDFCESSFLKEETNTHSADKPFRCSRFERKTAESEEELCGSKEENQRKQQLLDSALSPRAGVQMPSLSPGPDLNQENPETPQMKEEPEEQSVKQEEELLPVCVPEFITVCVKREESSLLQQRQTEHREETQGEDISSEPHFQSGNMTDTGNDDWERPFTWSAAKTIGLETSASVNTGHMSGTERAEGKKEECPICQKRFGRKDVLQRHIRVHTGEKPHSCSVCKKTFTRKYILQKHVRSHTGEKHIFIQCKANVTDVG